MNSCHMFATGKLESNQLRFQLDSGRELPLRVILSKTGHCDSVTDESSGVGPSQKYLTPRHSRKLSGGYEVCLERPLACA
eukprot:gene26415-biopygen16367